jgi:hypothetical protein
MKLKIDTADFPVVVFSYITQGSVNFNLSSLF